MNVICLLGRLCGDPELNHTESGVAVLRFSLAVDRKYTPKGEERQADFINIVAWRQTAELISKYFTKGQRIAIAGSLQSRKYTDKDGNNRTAYDVVAESFYFAESKDSSNSINIDRNEPQEAFAGQTDATLQGTIMQEIVDVEELPF